MTAALRPFGQADRSVDDRAPPGLLRATIRHIGWRELMWALAIVGAVISLSAISRIGLEKRFDLPRRFTESMIFLETATSFAVMLAMRAADEAVERGAARWPTYLGAVCVACAGAVAVVWWVLLLLGWQTLATPANEFPHYMIPVMLFLQSWVYATLACVAYVNRRIATGAAGRLHEAELARAASRRRTLESRLQAMQARVEPQFLFNTLAQVRDLFEHDPEIAGRMLEDLIAYLRAALPHLRESSSTLAQELRLVEAYLDIVRIRLRDGLAFAIEPVEGSLAGARMPPMMLLPLVVHALGQGTGPERTRCEIRVAARPMGGRLRVTVCDSGGAFAPSVETPELAGIVQRLHALFGDAARFERACCAESGSQAVLDLPRELAEDRTGDGVAGDGPPPDFIAPWRASRPDRAGSSHGARNDGARSPF